MIDDRSRLIRDDWERFLTRLNEAPPYRFRLARHFFAMKRLNPRFVASAAFYNGEWLE